MGEIKVVRREHKITDYSTIIFNGKITSSKMQYVDVFITF